METTDIDIGAIYTETLDVLRKSVWNYMRRTGKPDRDFDEWLSKAHAHFMEAVIKFDERSGTALTSWIYLIVYNGLFNDERAEAKHLTNKTRPPRIRPASLSRPWEVLEDLQRNGLRLLFLFIEAPHEIEKLLTHKDPLRRRKRLFKYLHETHGWTRAETAASFRDIRKLFEVD